VIPRYDIQLRQHIDVEVVVRHPGWFKELCSLTGTAVEGGEREAWRKGTKIFWEERICLFVQTARTFSSSEIQVSVSA
jgi:hypothetical protein